jgi:hypothetical protein
VAGLVLLTAWCIALGSCDGASHQWRVVAAVSPVRLAAVRLMYVLIYERRLA